MGDSDDGYTGIDNLEIMSTAVKYLGYLTGSVAALAGPPERAGRLLDFGAGSGTLATDLRDRGYDVTCVELDDQLQRVLTDHGLEVHADAGELEAASIDLAYSMNVLEHIEDHVSAIRELARVVRPGGRLLLYVPAFPVLYSSMDAKVGHVRRYRRAGLVDAVEQGGFRVDRCEHVDSLGFAATLAYKAVGSRDGDLGEGSVGFYDRFCFPVSRALDKGLHRWVGKNLLLVATRPPDPRAGA